MTAAATVASTSHQVVLDGGGKVALSGGGKTQILSMNAGWEQQWPQLVVQNLTFTDAYSGTQQTSGSSVYGGGAIFDEGGQLKVVNSAFVDDSCYASGPDLGGGAIRAVGMYPDSPSTSRTTPSAGTVAPTAARSAAFSPTSTSSTAC
jgi:hypothetical protein